MLAEPEAPIPWRWDRYLADGTVTLLASFMKVGESTLAYPLAVAVAQDRPFLGYSTRQGGVLILAVEEHPRDVKRRLRRFGMRPEDPIHVHAGPLVYAPATFRDLRQFIEAQKIALVILDTLPTFWDVQDENDNAELIQQATPLLTLARETNVVMLLLHHEGKSGGEGGRGIRGASALFGIVDQALLLDRRQGGTPTQRVLRATGRYDETPRELVIALAGDEYRRVGTAQEVKADARQLMVRDVLSDEPQDVKGLAHETKLTAKQVRDALTALGRRVIREGGGKRGNPCTYRRVEFDSEPRHPYRGRNEFDAPWGP